MRAPDDSALEQRRAQRRRDTARWRARAKAGRCLLHFEVDEVEVVVGLVAAGILDPLKADDPVALNAAAARALELFCAGDTSHPGAEYT